MFVVLALFTLLNAAHADSFEERLSKVELDSSWVSVRAFQPNLFMAIQPGEIPGVRDESYISVQLHAFDERILKLKERLAKGRVRRGDKFGALSLKAVKKN